MIARAVYRRPRILLLDEGTAHLNDALQRQVLANLAGLGSTIIAVTHDPRVLECADRCVRISPAYPPPFCCGRRSARCGGPYSLKPLRQGVGHAFSVFPSVRPATAAPRRPRDERW